MTQQTHSKMTALITGASGGIGLELSRLFARDGYNLILVARSAEKLQTLAREVEQVHGITATALPADLSQPNSARELYRQVQAKGIQVDALVNNAGFGILEPLASSCLEDSLEMLQLNVVSLTVLTQLFLPAMIQRRSGRIMNVGSTGSFAPVPLMAVYGATKAYVLSFSEAIAEEVRGTGVTVTAFCPGVTMTGFQARSGVNEARMLLKMGTMTAEQAARIGYRALMRGRPVIVPGFWNSLIAFSPRLAPRSFAARTSKRMMEPAAN
ncbi:MAG: SDR family NAD(P)-dependent oxidoreductase [Chloroflexota bacterium]|nr:SDR family oxidoreductase [Anaerolineales bacterium]